MTIFTDTFLPYEYKNKEQCYRYVVSRCHNIKKSLRLVEKDNEHLTVRCPLAGDYMDIVGTITELEWLDNELSRNKWYRPS